MWPFSSKKSNPNLQQVKFKLAGLHCTSCSLNIDGALEDTAGVTRAETNYAHSTSQIEFDPRVVSEQKLQQVITSLGYTVVTQQ